MAVMMMMMMMIMIMIMVSGVGQAGALAYFGKMDVPAHHSLGGLLHWQDPRQY